MQQVRDLENQLGEERKIRIKQETRAFAAASQSTKQIVEKSNTDKKPPLGPSKFRMPLRRITNFMPPPSPLQKQKTTITNSAVSSMHDKENNSRTTMSGTNTKGLMKPRRMSIAIRPPPPMSTQVFQPKRRVSIATFRPESTSNISTPLQTSRYKNGNVVGRQSFVRDPKKPRYSKLFSPLPEFRTASEITPMRNSSRFMGSPPTQAGSWRPKHPTVVALQRKSLVWSPLKLRNMQNARRPSLLPSRPSNNEVQ